MNFLQGTPVLVLGLGESGLAMARWCARHGALLSWWDSREQPPGAAALASEWPQAKRLQALPEAPAPGTLLLKSPGLAPADPKIAPVLAAARAAGIAAWSELDLFAQALADLKAARDYAPKVLAITGTNGKTTTTALAARLVERSGRPAMAAGNIGPSLLAALTQALDAAAADAATPLPAVWVLELSSFQLADSASGLFEPDAAALLNLSQDHLDWHGSMADYGAAKARIFGRRAVLVINREDRAVEALVPRPASAEAGKKGAKAPKPAEREVLRFGLDAPREAGDFGLVHENGMAWLVRALPSDDPAPRGRKRADDEELHLQRLMPADALRLRGRHNAANALAALALACAIGCPLAPMLHALREYQGEPHRVQPVLLLGGVEFYDDSKGTNVGATVAALEGLGAEKSPGRLCVILGGDGKGQDFTPLAAPLARHARAVATLGRDAAAIEAAVAAALEAVPLVRHETLQAATAWCLEQAHDGDAVLLSPACASLDMFRNYAHRAEVFVEAARALAAERGVLA